MKKDMKKIWLQGLLMAAVVAAAVLPLSGTAWADLQTTAGTSKESVFNPLLQIVSFASYVIGGVLVIAGVMKFKHHAENPTNAPLSHGFARVGAGAALLALPFLMGLANSTAQNTFNGTSSFQPFNF